MNKSILQSRIVSVEPATEALGLLSGGQPQPKPTETPKPTYEAAVGSSASTNLDFPGPSTSVVGPSPMKKLREAILSTLSPEQSTGVKDSFKKSKTKRQRVQGSCGEVITSDEVLERLKEEKVARKGKKTK